MNPRLSDTRRPVVGFTPWPIYPCGNSRWVLLRSTWPWWKQEKCLLLPGVEPLFSRHPTSILVIQLPQIITSLIISIRTENARLIKYFYSLCLRFIFSLFCGIPFIYSSSSLFNFFLLSVFLWPVL